MAGMSKRSWRAEQMDDSCACLPKNDGARHRKGALHAMKRSGFVGAGIAFGIAAGSPISIFLGDFALWIATGVCLCADGGAALSRSGGHDGAA
jgi:hypothetical protein